MTCFNLSKSSSNESKFRCSLAWIDVNHDGTMVGTGNVVDAMIESLDRWADENVVNSQAAKVRREHDPRGTQTKSDRRVNKVVLGHQILKAWRPRRHVEVAHQDSVIVLRETFCHLL